MKILLRKLILHIGEIAIDYNNNALSYNDALLEIMDRDDVDDKLCKSMYHDYRCEFLKSKIWCKIHKISCNIYRKLFSN